MKKLLFVLVCIFTGAGQIHAQGAFAPPATATKSISGVLAAAPGATITVCGPGATGIPCSPVLTAALFSDQALTQPLSNPFTSDSSGNYQFAAVQGTYTVTVTGTNLPGYSYQVQVGVGGIAYVGTLPATCTPGVTQSVQLNVAPFAIYFCSATNTWTALGATNASVTGCTTFGGIGYQNGTANTLTCRNLFVYNSSGNELDLSGSTSGTAAIGVNPIAGSPNKMLVPTATGQSGAFLQTDGGNPQNLSWVAGYTPTATNGANIYASGTNTPGSDTNLLYVKSFAGADLGAQINACTAALTNSVGTCFVSNLGNVSQTLSTAVTVPSGVTLRFQSGTKIAQQASIKVSSNASVECSPDTSVLFTKGANIDQFVMSGASSLTVQNKNSLLWCSMNGNKASYTGNGVDIGDSTLDVDAVVSGNIIYGEANDAIYNIATGYVDTYELISNNAIFTFGVHAFQNSGGGTPDFVNNKIYGDGTATGTDVALSQATRFEFNQVYDDNAAILVDAAATASTVSFNRLQQVTSQYALRTVGVAVGNVISGSTGSPTVLVTGGVFSKNTVTGNGATDVVLVQGTNLVVDQNIVNMNVAGTSSGSCGINLNSDQIGIRVTNNTVNVSDSRNVGNTDNGICDTPTGTHNLNIVISGNIMNGTFTGTVTSHALVVNNAAGLTTNWAVTWTNNGSVHFSAPTTTGSWILRTDTHNNTTSWIDNLPSDSSTFDNGTGSSTDVFVQSNTNNLFTFATLPSPAGNGSQIYCTDCTTGSVVTSGGSGGLVTKVGSVWVGRQTPNAMVVTSAYTNATTGQTNVTGLSFPLAASTNYSVSCHLVYQGSAATASLILSSTGPASPTAIAAMVRDQLTSGTSATYDSTASHGTSFAFALGGGTVVSTATDMEANLSLGIENGTTAGTWQLTAASAGAGSVTIQIGSTCTIQ